MHGIRQLGRDRPVLAATLQGLAAAVVTSCTDALT